MNAVIRKERCKGFSGGFCWVWEGHPLYGRHYGSEKLAWEAAIKVDARAVNLALGELSGRKRPTVAKIA